MAGVLWDGSDLIPGVDKAMDELRQKGTCIFLYTTPRRSTCKPGKRIFFVTNNSTKSRAAFLGKFKGFGIQASLVSFRATHENMCVCVCVLTSFRMRSLVQPLQQQLISSMW